MEKSVLLINPNRMRPPVAPLALDLLAEALEAEGFPVRLLDLTFCEDVKKEVTESLRDLHEEHLFAAVSVRNIDDAHFASSAFRLPEVKNVIEAVRTESRRPVVLGGVGFSIMPAAVLRYTGADMGIAGDGEHAIVELARRLKEGSSQTVPGLVRREGKKISAVPPVPFDLARAGPASRRYVDNVRYEREGAMVGFETKRGCPAGCTYCADPVAKGKTIRMRKPEDTAAEIESLVERGVTHFHTCDSEFNLPVRHALAVCRALRERGLGDRIRWYAYASPAPFDSELAEAMRKAGCAGINFGTDHCDPRLLRRLGRSFGPEAITEAAHAAHKAGLSVMFDLLLGSPGETRKTASRALDFFGSLPADAVGVSWGVRIYPGTPLAREIRRRPREYLPGLVGKAEAVSAFLRGEDEAALEPLWFLSPELGEDFGSWIAERTASDPRFLASAAPQREAVHNYNDNEELVRAIREGERGAFWHILVRTRKKKERELK